MLFVSKIRLHTVNTFCVEPTSQCHSFYRTILSSQPAAISVIVLCTTSTERLFTRTPFCLYIKPLYANRRVSLLLEKTYSIIQGSEVKTGNAKRPVVPLGPSRLNHLTWSIDEMYRSTPPHRVWSAVNKRVDFISCYSVFNKQYFYLTNTNTW